MPRRTIFRHSALSVIFYDALRFDQKAVALGAERHQIALPNVEGIEQPTPDRNPTRPSHASDLFPGGGFAMLSEYLIVRNRRGSLCGNRRRPLVDADTKAFQPVFLHKSVTYIASHKALNLKKS